MQIEFDRLQKIISESSYQTTGAITEQRYHNYIQQFFPNSEVFWRLFIVPLTNRINKSPGDTIYYNPREGVSSDLEEIGSIHYSIFLHLVYAHQTLERCHFSFFENFYTHLGTVCDLAEEFLIKLHFLIMECKELPSPIFQKLTRDEFLEIAGRWYDKEYNKLYEIYLRKGKPNPIKIPTRKHILDEYFEESDSWKNYKVFTNLIKQYRNVIVHHHKVAFLQDPEGNEYVPKKEKISEYKSWKSVEHAAKDPNKFEDFILQNVLMQEDLKIMQIVLNNLWMKPIEDLQKVFFGDKNRILLAKYNLNFV